MAALKAHELARRLLAGPDDPVVFGVDDWVYPVEAAEGLGHSAGSYERAVYLGMVDGEVQVIT